MSPSLTRMSENLVVQDSGLRKLCSTCRCIFNRWDRIVDRLEELEPKDLSYYDDVRMWIASADDGCVFCFRMLDNLGRDRAEVLLQTLASGTRLKMETRINSSFQSVSIYSTFFEAGTLASSGEIERAITYLHPEIPGMKWFIRMRNWAVLTNLLPRIVLQPKLERSTGSFTSLAFARNWLKICTDSHQQCSREQPVRLPTRLLWLCSEGVRLSTPEKMDVACQYSTLSHCWGKINMFKVSNLRWAIVILLAYFKSYNSWIPFSFHHPTINTSE